MLQPDQLAGNRWLPAAAQAPCAVNSSNYFYFYFIFLFWTFRRMGVQHPHFLRLAPTLGSAKSSIPQRDWRFHFFSKFSFAKFKVQLDLHIYCWDFCFTKI
jgi:hypothetical protein